MTHLCGSHDVVFADFLASSSRDYFEHVYCCDDENCEHDVLWRHAGSPSDEHAHMRFLHQKGFNKAVILHVEHWRFGLESVHVTDVQPQHEIPVQRFRTRTPLAQPTLSTWAPPFAALDQLPRSASCLLNVDLEELGRFLTQPRTYYGQIMHLLICLISYDRLWISVSQLNVLTGL